jgi:hypothetical protein
MLKEFLSYKKRVLRIINRCGSRDSRRKHFSDLYILPSRLQYIYSLMIFVIKNINKVHYKINTRHIMDIHMAQVNLVCYYVF